MKRIVISVIALLCGSVAVNAADMPVKAAAAPAAVVAPVYNWSGWYLGGHAGWGNASFEGIFDGFGAEHQWSRNDQSGGLLGGQIGFNAQNGVWVWGAEADWSWAPWQRDIVDNENDVDAVKTKSLASVRGRLGIASNNWLIYATGGWGWGHFRIGTQIDEGPGGSAWRSKTGSGPVFGGGIEWAFSPNWSLRGEYLHYAFNDTLPYPSGIVPDADSGDFFRVKHVNVLRLGVNYRFSWAP